MILNGKRVNLEQLQDELQAAGVSMPRGLGQTGDNLHTYTVKGEPLELSVAAQAVVQNHIAVFKRPKAAAEYRAEWQAITDQWQTASGTWGSATAAQKLDLLQQGLGLVNQKLTILGKVANTLAPDIVNS